VHSGICMLAPDGCGGTMRRGGIGQSRFRYLDRGDDDLVDEVMRVHGRWWC
jgi:hypothetical protein